MHLPTPQPHCQEGRGSPDPPLPTGPRTGSPPPSALSPLEGPDSQSPLSVLTVIPTYRRMSTFCPVSYHTLATPSWTLNLCPLEPRIQQNLPLLPGSPSLCLALTPNSPLRALSPWGPGSTMSPKLSYTDCFLGEDHCVWSDVGPFYRWENRPWEVLFISEHSQFIFSGRGS